jgi:signal transduction histidine kinase
VSILLLVSLVTLAVALAASVVLFARTGELRLGLLAGLLGAIAIPQALALWQAGWTAPLGADAPTAAAAAALAASLLGLLTVLAMGRTIRELERAEALHWESMEGVRGVTELASRRGMAVEDKLPLLLELGCERLELPIGLISRVHGERYELVALHAPENFPVAEGAAFALADTACRFTLASERPVARERADELPEGGAGRGVLPFEAYLGASIQVGDETFGTLAFGAFERRQERFSATHKDLIALMAQWIGADLERQRLRQATPQAPPRSAPPTPRQRGLPPRRPAAKGGVALNELVERLDRRIRRAAGNGVEVVLDLSPDLAPAREMRLPLEAIVLALVRKAGEAVAQGGAVVVSTANHEFAREPGVMPEREPDLYVTLSVSETSGTLDADAFSRVFETDATPESEDNPMAHPETRIALPTVYRMLQRVGGDLSVEVEPGRASTFTIFLPRQQDTAKTIAREEPVLTVAGAAPTAH